MASSKEYLAYILEQLSGLEDIRYRAMMGEYILYYREKVVDGVIVNEKERIIFFNRRNLNTIFQ